MFKNVLILWSITSMLGLSELSAQNFTFGVGFGGMNYQGELTSGGLGEILQITNPAFKLSLTYPLSDHLEFSLSGVFGKIEGDDRLSRIQYRKERNLNFVSKINEFAVSAEYNFLSFSGDFADYRFTPFIEAGVGVFFFDPKTYFLTQEVRLQPIGTEGQGLIQFPERQKYKLSGLVIPFGAGAKLRLNDKMTISLALDCHLTFTDYLDDVSTKYVNYNDLLAGNGPLSAALGNRTGEYFGTAPVDTPSGGKRGTSSNNDFYYTAFLSLHTQIFGWASNVKGCPRF
ncbi:MAG: DUF6089 family protein [Saprospiraceae bacterium]